jgi:uncharacterized membrane protein
LLRRQTYWAPLLVGAALMAGVDEIVFHQLLAWHHFYDKAGTEIGLVSDGILHALELFALVGGFFLIADTIRKGAFDIRAAWAGFVVGAGLFQLWDGIIDHKALRIHQVRYGVDLLPYDIAWNAAALVLLAVGAALTVVAMKRHRSSSQPSTADR